MSEIQEIDVSSDFDGSVNINITFDIDLWNYYFNRKTTFAKTLYVELIKEYYE